MLRAFRSTGGTDGTSTEDGTMHENGSFVIRFFPTATGRSISLRHNDEFIGSFKTVGAAKRRARQIVTARKAVQS